MAHPELTKHLQGLLQQVSGMLRNKVDADHALQAEWKAEHTAEVNAQRTGEPWETWLSNRVTQVASSWILLTIFARFIEDNHLFGEDTPLWIMGGPGRRDEALDARLVFLRDNDTATEADWLARIITEFEHVSATAGLVGSACMARKMPLSATAAQEIIRFWSATHPEGGLRWIFTDESLDTRFLGDVYQDLSEDIRDKYALLQTPEFVEEYILDHTLEPALADRPLQGFKLIDPTCGSGHFLLGSFQRLVQRWREAEPGLGERKLVQEALSCIYGVDVNPYAIDIARFRLLICAAKVLGESDLTRAPELTFNLRHGDSLWRQFQGNLGEHDSTFDDAAGARASRGDHVVADMLRPGTFDVVVGNPPYKTVKDKVLNGMYRTIYRTCHRQYALSVPFMERFFELAIPPGEARPVGYTGQITANSFMKREFGSKLIEDYLPSKNLTLVVDSSGAYIPGHGTPTVIVCGKNEYPTKPTVRVVMGVRGEPGKPENPARAHVWSSIADHTGDPGYEDEWISVADAPRDSLATHPWSLQGGAAVDLQQQIESPHRTFKNKYGRCKIGGAIRAGSDDAFIRPDRIQKSSQINLRDLVQGEQVRHYCTGSGSLIILPHEIDEMPVNTAEIEEELWPLRALLAQRRTFQGDMAAAGLRWFDYMQMNYSPYVTPLSIVFAFVATHNHFVLDRGGKVFKQSAPVIKLPEEATEDQHLELLGVLNSSTACFWLKQNSHDKGNGGIGGGIASTEWERFYEFTGTTLKDFPLPASFPLERARTLDTLAQELSAVSPRAVAERAAPTAARLADAQGEAARIRALMIFHQEELDWETYRLYGIVDRDYTYGGEPLEIALGERAFEITLARGIEADETHSEWFRRHNSTPITEIPASWPQDYRALVQARMELAQGDRNIALLERPEYKRRWDGDAWSVQAQEAQAEWLLDQLETESLWRDAEGRPSTRSLHELASAVDELTIADEFYEVLTDWYGSRNSSRIDILHKLLQPESVSHAAALRFKESGLRKRRAWEETWELQRREDAGEDVGDIPVPPKYTSSDFLDKPSWSHRGKLDVPKERFIRYTGYTRAGDRTMILGWAGWNHLDQAVALATLLSNGASEQTDDVVMSLAAGLHETLPWVKQWHAGNHPEWGGEPHDQLTAILDTTLRDRGQTVADVAAWRPPSRGRGRRSSAR